MSIKDLNSTLVCCSCGLCCSEEYLCNNCLENTLAANGIPKSFSNRIRGLKYKSSSHGNEFPYSELYMELKTVINQLSTKINSIT